MVSKHQYICATNWDKEKETMIWNLFLVEEMKPDTRPSKKLTPSIQTLSQNPQIFINRLKDLKLKEGFHSKDINYVSKRI